MDLINIESNLKNIQSEQLKILIEFDRICRKNNINYQLFAGSLLGSVRHQGFIPWDDDIDVCMLRDDYERFLKICETELNQTYFLQTPKTDKNSMFSFTKIRKNNTVFKEAIIAELDMHHGIFIDIFPLDNISPNTILGKSQLFVLTYLRKIKKFKLKKKCSKSSSRLKSMVKYLIHYLIKPISIKNFNCLEIRIAQLIKKGNGYVSHLSNGETNKIYMKYAMKKNQFENIIEGEFEEHQFFIPKNYDEVLEQLFGDYMSFPPIEEQVPYHDVCELALNIDKR